jgi:hypothetical protein
MEPCGRRSWRRRRLRADRPCGAAVRSSPVRAEPGEQRGRRRGGGVHASLPRKQCRDAFAAPGLQLDDEGGVVDVGGGREPGDERGDARVRAARTPGGPIRTAPALSQSAAARDAAGGGSNVVWEPPWRTVRSWPRGDSILSGDLLECAAPTKAVRRRPLGLGP